MKLVYLLPVLIFFIVTPAFAYNSGFRPIYQPSSSGGSPPTELYCTLGEFLNSYNSTTNSFTCGAGGGGGENNTASSSGLGESLVLPKVGVDLPFKGISVSGDLTIESNSTDITIGHTAGPMGSSALDDLTDVIITSPSSLSVLFYDGANWIDKIFSVNTQTPTNGNFITGINNQTGAITRQILKANNFDVNCSDTEQINRLQYDNQTGTYTGTCETDDTILGGSSPRGGYLVGHWTQSQTKTNIGTSFIDVYPQTNSNGKAILIDTDAFTTMRLQIQWNKVGSGTQTCQVITGILVLVSTDVVSGSNDSAFDAIPVTLLNAENPFRLQCKSTTAGDDPIFESASIWIK